MKKGLKVNLSIFLILVASMIMVSATLIGPKWHDSNNVVGVTINGFDISLQSAIDNNWLEPKMKRTVTASEAFTPTHLANEILIAVGAKTRNMQDGINSGVLLDSNIETSMDLLFGHLASEIEIYDKNDELKSFQAAIDGGTAWDVCVDNTWAKCGADKCINPGEIQCNGTCVGAHNKLETDSCDYTDVDPTSGICRSGICCVADVETECGATECINPGVTQCDGECTGTSNKPAETDCSSPLQVYPGYFVSLSGTCVAGECCIPSWTPSWIPSNNCVGTSQVQTDGCGHSRTLQGTKVSTTFSYSPARSTRCSYETVTKTGDQCGETSQVSGTKPVGSYGPATSAYCAGTPFIQTRTCGSDRPATGTASSTSWTYSPARSTVCSDSTTVTATGNCGDTTQVAGTKNCCSGWGPPTSTYCSGKGFDQIRSCSVTGLETRPATGTGSPCPPPCDPQGCPSGSCGTWYVYSSADRERCGTSTRSCGSCSSPKVCGGYGSGHFGYCYTPACEPSWSPSRSSKCSGTSFTQSDGCGNTRTKTGTKTTGSCADDDDTTTTTTTSTPCSCTGYPSVCTGDCASY